MARLLVEMRLKVIRKFSILIILSDIFHFNYLLSMLFTEEILTS